MISIIIPVYNGEKYLRECLDSILAQTCADIEVLAVDDGSADATADIIRGYAEADPRVRYIYKPNGGQSSARNCGLEYAKGEYVSFVDSDDTLLPEFCETLLSALGDADIAICGFSREPKKGCIPRPENIVASDFIEKTLYQTRFHNSAWAAVYRRSLFGDIRFAEGLYYEDLDIFYRLIEASGNDVVWIDAPLYVYRDNPASFINTFTPRRLDVLKVTAQIEKHYAGTPLLAAARDRRFSANYNMALLAGLDGRHDISRRCWSLVKAYRREVILNPRSRIKNRLGAAVSCLGRRISLLIAKISRC